MSFGGVIKLTGEDSYRRALAQIMASYREMVSEMKLVNSMYDKSDHSMEAVSARNEAAAKIVDTLAKKLQLQKERLAELEGIYSSQAAKIQTLTAQYNHEVSVLEELGETLGESSDEYKAQEKAVRQLESELNNETKAQANTESSMADLRKEMNNTQAEMNTTSKSADELEGEIQETGKAAKESEGGFTVMKGALASLVADGMRAAINAAKELVSALVNIGKQSYASYGEYQQLVGGVETLYGDSAGKLQEYAQKAYATAGISANKYMEQSTSFAAILLQGVKGNTEKAVEYADLAIRDMSDNANKMGTSMQAIQNAYQGFAKQNYTIELMSAA